MDKKEILEKAQKNKYIIGEAEQKGISKSGWISLIVAGIFAVAMMIVEGVLGHFSTIYVLAALCFLWSGVFYLLQYVVAKRKYFGILLGSILCFMAFVFFLTRYILAITGIWW